MIRYVFGDQPLRIKNAKNADAQKIGEALAAVPGQKPRAVVEAARDPASVLHEHFDWDDGVAAEKWRMDQAREIVRCVRVHDERAGDEPVRAFHSIVTGDGVAYHSLQEVRTSPDLRDRLLEAAERDLIAFQTRYRVLKDVCAAVEPAKEMVRAKRGKNNETRAAA